MVEDAWSKKAPGGFGVWGAVLQEAPGQKRPRVVLERRARPLVKKAPWWFWGLGRGRPRAPGQICWRPLVKRAPDGFGGSGAPPGQKGPLVVLGFGG
jgi:hypothetical protein